MEDNKIISMYKITYLDNGFIQYKNLISKNDWDNILKPLKEVISELEYNNKGKESKESLKIKNILKTLFLDYNICFPEGSPLHLSINDGLLKLPKTQGGNHKVLWENLN